REVADILADCEQQLEAYGALREFSGIPAGKARRPWWMWASAAALLLPLVGLGVYGAYRMAGASTPPGGGGADDRPEAATWAEVAACVGHKGPVRGLAFGPGGRFLASAGTDRSVRVWGPEEGKPLRVLKFQHGGLGTVAVAGNMLVA